MTARKGVRTDAFALIYCMFSQGVFFFWLGDGRLSTALDVDFFFLLIRRYTYKVTRNL